AMVLAARCARRGGAVRRLLRAVRARGNERLGRPLQAISSAGATRRQVWLRLFHRSARRCALRRAPGVRALLSMHKAVARAADLRARQVSQYKSPLDSAARAGRGITAAIPMTSTMPLRNRWVAPLKSGEPERVDLRREGVQTGRRGCGKSGGKLGEGPLAGSRSG